MRNILLSVVVVAVLIGAAVGGTLADFSDIEVSQDNYFKTGSLDLTVSNDVGTEYNGDSVPAFFQVSDAWPCCDKSVFFDLENWGQGFQKEPYVYIHFKHFECGWVVPKLVYKWIDCVEGECVEVEPPPPPEGYDEWVEGMQGTGLPKPVTEPEYVAECGGIAGEDEDGEKVEVPGIGCCYGDQCQLARHIDIGIWIMGPWPHEDKPKTAPALADPRWTLVDISEYDRNGDGKVKLNEIECEEILLRQLPNCNGIWVHVALHLQDIDEDDLFEEGFFDENIPAEAKWDHWPTNALQKDGLHFDIAFELLQNPVPED